MRPPAQWSDPQGPNGAEFHKQPMGPPTFTNSALKKNQDSAGSAQNAFFRNKTGDEREADTRKWPHFKISRHIRVE